MKVLIVNTYDKGGAANACLRLHEGLLQKNIDSKVLLKKKEKEFPRTFQIQNTNYSNKYQLLKQKWLGFLRVVGILEYSRKTLESKFKKQRPVGLEMFSFPYSNYDITSSPLYQEADIIHLHWVANFLDYESFFSKNTKPVIWTLHDMNPFTGGEHYLETFLGIDDFGYPVTRTFSAQDNVVTKKNLLLKQKVLRRVSNLIIVAPSVWLCQLAQESSVFNNKNVCCIPNGINSEIFQPRDRNYSRDILNIPKDKTVILFVADSIRNHRKGYVYLKKAFNMMQRSDVILCAIGSIKNELDAVKNTIQLGVINDERLMSIAYSAADVFVVPSLMDNLPNTVLESLVCGTPVIGFPVGGIPDMVKHGYNGLLTTEVNALALFEAITLFLNTKDNFKRSAIRTDALVKYDLSIQSDEYIKLYQKIMSR